MTKGNAFAALSEVCVAVTVALSKPSAMMIATRRDAMVGSDGG